MTDELIDIYDENNKPQNVRKMKSEAHKFGLWHRTAHIWIYNSKKEILLQLRAKDKDTYPNEWDISSAGHVSAGEEPEVSAIRELKEELGINAKKEDLNFIRLRKSIHQFRDIKNSELEYIFTMKFDGDADKLKIQKEELQKVKFFSITELEKELKENKSAFVPHGNYWDEMIDRIKKAN